MSAQRGESPRSGDALERQPDLRRVLRMSLLTILFGGIGAFAITLYFHDVRGMWGAGAVALSAAPLLAAYDRGYVRFATTAAVLVLLLVAVIEVLAGAGVRDVAVSVFAVVVLMSGLLFDRRTALLFTVLCVLSVAVIGFGETSGLITTELSHTVPPGEVAILVFLLAAFGWLANSVTGALYKGFRDVALGDQTYREIFNATSDAIVVHAIEDGAVMDANDTACAMTGFSREELLAMSFADLTRVGEEHSGRSAMELLRKATDGVPQVFEWKSLRKDGSELWLEVALRAVTIKGEMRVLAALRDVRDRKQAEERLQATERLQALGRLAGGVAHDFNNQLAAIVASAELLRAQGESAPAPSHVEVILQCSRRAADLTRQLLAFARKGGRRQDVVDVNALIDEVTSLLERSSDKRLRVSVDLAPCARVLGDASFLQNALLNLALNARDAMPEGGDLSFCTSVLPSAALTPAQRAGLRAEAEDFVCITVRDNGCGIPPAVIDRIFEPFFTTKVDGSGMGLSAAYGTVEAHGGSIHVTSELGRGTCFELLLPASSASDERPEVARESGPPPPLRVLLAEDEALVARACSLLLEELGCSVTWCKDGREALSVFEREPDAFDLAILDHSMPHILGDEVASCIQRRRPGIPLVATSGFGDAWYGSAARGTMIFLPKPFDLAELRGALDQAMAQRDQAS